MKAPAYLLAAILFLFGCAVNAQQGEAVSSLSTDEAVGLAHTAVIKAKEMGYSVSATVVDEQGNILATVKGESAYPHTPKTSFKKAFTAIIAKEPTSSLITHFTKGDGLEAMNQFIVSNLNQSDNIVLLGGGVPLKRQGKIVGAIGVGGAPGGHLDDQVIMETLVSLGWAD